MQIPCKAAIKKRLWAHSPKALRKQPYSSPAFFTPNGTSPMVLRRHFPVTLPFAGRILPNSNYMWNLEFCQALNPKSTTVYPLPLFPNHLSFTYFESSGIIAKLITILCIGNSKRKH
jgi:hypothetical protein